jgi:hypothetical protein
MADSMFRFNELAVSRGWYNQALSLKPNETYPLEQLAEIKKRIDERSTGKSENQFREFITNSDAAFRAGNINIARYWIKKAEELFPDHQDVKAKKLEIDKIEPK